MPAWRYYILFVARDQFGVENGKKNYYYYRIDVFPLLVKNDCTCGHPRVSVRPRDMYIIIIIYITIIWHRRAAAARLYVL